MGKLNLVDLAGSERQNKAGPNTTGGTTTQPTGGAVVEGVEAVVERAEGSLQNQPVAVRLGNVDAALSRVTGAPTSPTGTRS